MIFNIKAVRATERAANAARDSVDLMKAVETGVLRIENLRPLSKPEATGWLKDRSSTQFALVNRGRTRVDPLRVTTFLRYLDHIPSATDEDTTHSQLPVGTSQIFGTIVAEGMWKTPVIPCWEEDRLIDMTTSVPPVHRRFYLWGSVSYLTAFNEAMEFAYCYVWDARKSEWRATNYVHGT